jgi:serine protease
MGGTSFAQVSTQYYQTNADGSQTFVTNPTDQLGGVWIDDSSHMNLPSTAPIADVQTALGKEASLAAAHFGLTPADLLNADIVIAQPQVYSDPAAASLGYCAWHDYTEPGIEGNVYNGDTYGMSFTNMPYILNQGSSCGQNAITPGAAGNLDGESIVLGHEIEETVTDPGAEDVINGQNLGGWYDSEEYEIGDKCAWVGQNLLGVGPQPFPVPGAVGTTKGNKGTTFPVQSLWSNESANGVGWCAGAGTDLAASPAASVPEVPAALLIPVLGLATAFGGIFHRRRRRRAALAS